MRVNRAGVTQYKIMSAILSAMLVTGVVTGCKSDNPKPAPSPNRSAPTLAVPVGPSASPSGSASPGTGTDTGTATGTDTGDAADDPAQPGADADAPAPSDAGSQAAPFQPTAEHPAPGVTCNDPAGSLDGICSVDLAGWPAHEDMLSAGAVSQFFVDTAWTMDAFAAKGPTSPDEALAKAVHDYGTDNLAATVKTAKQGAAWQAWAAMGGTFKSCGPGYMIVEPLLDAPHSATSFQARVSYRILAHAGTRSTDNWYGDQSFITVTLVKGPDRWLVDAADPSEMPAAKIEDHGANFQ